MIHNIFVRANMQKGKMALAAHQPEQAAADFKAAMEYPEDLGTGRPAQPNLTEQYYWLGVALTAQNKSAEAAKTWDTAAQGNGSQGNRKADVFSALAYRKLGQNDRAQQILQQVIARASQPSPDANPDTSPEPSPDANDFYVAGLAAQYQGDKEHAQQYFRSALMLDPLFWPARVATAEMNSAGTFGLSL